MKTIYFDHSATTPVEPRVLKEMLPYFSKKFGNASSLYSLGKEGALAVEKARQRVANFLNCETSEIVFTSGGTESNNLVLKGLVKALSPLRKKIHIITSSIEHDAILEPCADLEKEGVSITYLPVKPNGIVDIEILKKAIRPETVLVSIMYANNEVGVIEPIQEIGELLKKQKNKIYFHTDATQAVNALDCDVQKLGVDFLSISGHKIYGPKGVGALFVKKGSSLKGIQLGGHQENNLRSGTLNVPGIVGLGKAIELAGRERLKNNSKIFKLRNKLIAGILKEIPDVILNTDIDNALPSHAHFSFLGAEGEAILFELDFRGIEVSTGSACASGSLEPSHVLLAMGLSPETAHGAIRFSLGKGNTAEDIQKTLKVLPLIISKLRAMNPLYKN
ncbi:MAG TPA: cysteine desulfurase family protein [Candidatus Pacearchaeota archaeon]|nr:cysteine desulfurase family protein [Candidatus Pacearchaeota archaeon]